eukprot:1803903-Alexandrium_andersonii.AAC.1
MEHRPTAGRRPSQPPASAIPVTGEREGCTPRGQLHLPILVRRGAGRGGDALALGGRQDDVQ